MNPGNRSHVLITAALIACAALISAPASANHGEKTRALLLAPLVLPAAILSATLPQPVVYETHQPRYNKPHYRNARRAPSPPRRHHRYRDNRRYDHHYRR
ncbi:MAG: hypothetical protein LBU45_00585 [Azoarcus sp.]|jgi:hypothetical protein|nr:hypothetical protein [Azoarcus sp.]